MAGLLKTPLSRGPALVNPGHHDVQAATLAEQSPDVSSSEAAKMVSTVFIEIIVLSLPIELDSSQNG